MIVYAKKCTPVNITDTVIKYNQVKGVWCVSSKVQSV